MTELWHWTTPARLARIVQDGKIKPHRDGDIARVLPVVWLTADPDANFWRYDEEPNATERAHLHRKTVRLLVDVKKAVSATDAFDLPPEVMAEVATSGLPNLTDDWYVSFKPISTDQIRCLLYDDGSDTIRRFRTATYDDERLTFVGFD